MHFAPEREAAYRNTTFIRQQALLRVLVMFPAPLLLIFIYLQSLLTGIPYRTWLQNPLLYVLLASLLGISLWMRSIRRSGVFAWAGVVMMASYCLSCALMTLPGSSDTIALMLPLYIASPLVIAPFWARLPPVIAMILLSYLAGTVALAKTGASNTLWIAYGMQALVGASVALFSAQDRRRRAPGAFHRDAATRAVRPDRCVDLPVESPPLHRCWRGACGAHARPWHPDRLLHRPG